MPTYPLIHKETGEKKELSMTMLEYVKWKEQNPEWDKDWSAGVAGVGEVGEWKDKLIRRNPSWNTVLERAGKMPGSNVKPIS
jgi:hypothetical protein